MVNIITIAVVIFIINFFIIIIWKSLIRLLTEYLSSDSTSRKYVCDVFMPIYFKRKLILNQVFLPLILSL